MELLAKFITEMTRLIDAWNNSTLLMDIGLKILMVVPALLLQKPSYQSTAKQHSECLSRRLSSWKNGDFNKLLIESEQSRQVSFVGIRPALPNTLQKRLLNIC